MGQGGFSTLERKNVEEISPTNKNGSASAAILAAGVASFALGVITTLVEAVPEAKSALSVVDSVGPLSGKIEIVIAIWLVAWLVLHFVWKDTNQNLSQVLGGTFGLIALGLIGTFPLFYDLFAAR